MAGKSSLTPRDWIIAGMASLAAGGVEAVRVERLAKQLKTTKGSFYWHFADRAALLEAMLALWEREGTRELIANATTAADPGDRLRQVTTQALAVLGRLDTPNAETAIRIWAAQDGAVGQRFARIETERVRFLTGQLVALGYQAPVATSLAKALYLTLIGLYSVRPYASELADESALLALLERIIADAPRAQ